MAIPLLFCLHEPHVNRRTLSAQITSPKHVRRLEEGKVLISTSIAQLNPVCRLATSAQLALHT